MKFLRYFFCSYIVLGFSACEDVVDLDVPEGPTRLVVDGLLTDRDEVQTVKLTYTAPYFSNTATPAVTGATVIISDELGNQEELSETAPGIYQKQFAGMIGHSYQLTIETSEGENFQSQSELLQAVPPIDTIYAEFEEASLFNEDEGYLVSIGFADPGGIANFYRWRYYINGEKQSKPEDIAILFDEYFEGKEDLPFTFGYALLPGDTARAEQLSISEGAYDFLSLVREQTAEVGTPLDTPPAPIKGNIVNIEDANDFALGYFMVSAIVSKEIIIEKTE